MRTTFNTQYYCRRSKANSHNLAPVELSININGDRKFINLPWKANVDDFNKKRQPTQIQSLMREWDKKVDTAISDILSEGLPLTTDTLRDRLRTGGVKSYTIRDCFEDYLRIIKQRVGMDLTQSAYRKYELTRDLFFDFTDADNEITTVTPALIQEYYIHLQNKYPSLNSSASYIRKTSTIIKFAIDNGKLRVNPFQNIRVKTEKKPIEYLTKEEIAKIESTEYSTAALQRVADVFIVQIYSGLAFSDIERLRKEDIKEQNGVYYIQKPRVKTGVEYTAVLFPKAVEILEKYDYCLPIISNQKTNSALKAIAREASIDKSITDHYGRKTYGCLLLNNNVRMDTVAKALGHARSTTTAKYYAVLEKDTVVNELSQALGF